MTPAPEYTTPQDQYFSYCLWPYAPVAATENKLRPVNLLYHSFDLAGMDDRAFDLVQAIRQAIGPFRTVWGVKRIGDRLAWEFYFYDYKRRERDVSITRVVEALRPFARCDVPVNEQLPYFMFSIDIDQALASSRRDLTEIHMYIGNPGSAVSSGIAYALRRDSTALENFYFFFDAKRQLNDAAAKICCSAHVDCTRVPIDHVLWPQLRNCNTLCVANKQQCDTIYYSGVNVEQLLFFLHRLRYPAGICDHITRNRAQLDHLLYDVGFDYITDGADLRILKSGYYGVF